MESLWENDEEKNQMFLATKVGFNIYAYNKIVKRWLFVFNKDMGPKLIMNHRYMDFFIAENCFFYKIFLRKTSEKIKNDLAYAKRCK